jgi:hypothetical protein
MKEYTVIFLAFISIIILITVYRLIRRTISLTGYSRWVKQRGIAVLENKHERIQLWKDADVTDRYTPRAESPWGQGCPQAIKRFGA